MRKLQQEAMAMIKYDKDRLLNNIDFLLEKNNIKKGELEQFIEVSPGYLSRIKASDNVDASPNIDKLSLIASKLNCSIISLLFCDYASLTETEIYLVNSLESIIDKTNNDQVVWCKLSPSSFLHSGFPLCFKKENMFLKFDFDEYAFRSSFLGKTVGVVDNVYYSKNKSDTIYIIPVREEDETQYEIYINSKGEVAKIINGSSESKSGILKILQTLYDVAVFSSKKVRIDESVRQMLGGFSN